MEHESIPADLLEKLSFSDILDNIDAGIVIYDAAGNFVYVNTVMINWRNIPRSEYLKMNIRDFYDVLDVCVFDLVCREKRRISRLQYYHERGLSALPARVRIVTGTPIFDRSGEIQYVITLLQDVDEFNHHYKSLRDQHKILQSDRRTPIMEKIPMVAHSTEILQLLSVTDTISRLDSTVLLTGESGTGKEVFARYIHEHSGRSNKPLITVNCAAFPENLIEAELFGYERGSFTGAAREGKIGLAEAADGGTLFLDEINSLPLSVQGKVLRMIEEKSVQRVGSIHPKKVDFRLIAATNRILREEVEKGTFREDLYYRLNVIPISIPPIRSRRDDIIPLCLHFLHEFCMKYNMQKTFSDDVLRQLRSYDWPGNVREIRNFVERMVVMTPNLVKEITSIPAGMLEPLTEDPVRTHIEPIPMPSAVRRPLTRERVIEALNACGQRREEAAEYLGISRRQLQYRIKQYHLSSRCRYAEQEEEG